MTSTPVSLPQCNAWWSTWVMPSASPPDERMFVGVPVGGSSLHRLADLGPTREPMALERERAQDFPPRLNQVQIRRIRGLKDELPARMRQTEEQHIHRAVGAQVVQDGVDPRGLRREPGVDLFQKVHPVGDRAAACRAAVKASPVAG